MTDIADTDIISPYFRHLSKLQEDLDKLGRLQQNSAKLVEEYVLAAHEIIAQLQEENHRLRSGLSVIAGVVNTPPEPTLGRYTYPMMVEELSGWVKMIQNIVGQYEYLEKDPGKEEERDDD